MIPGDDINAMSLVDSSRHWMGRISVAVLDALLPPRCLKCGAIMAQTGNLCSSCWHGVEFISPPFCHACGVPFEFESDGEALCAACLHYPPGFDRARAVFRYDDFSRDLILAFKHGDRTDAAPAFGRWLARAGEDVLDGADYLIPVPLHWSRLFRRRYNQSAVLAAAISGETGIAVLADALRRPRRTRSQGRLSASERKRNLRGAIALNPGYENPGHGETLAGRNIVLVDDVMTSGATVGECVRVLDAAGVERVDVLTLARVGGPPVNP